MNPLQKDAYDFLIQEKQKWLNINRQCLVSRERNLDRVKGIFAAGGFRTIHEEVNAKFAVTQATSGVNELKEIISVQESVIQQLEKARDAIIATQNQPSLFQ